MTMALATLSSASYLTYLNKYVDLTMNITVRALLEHLDESFMDEIQEYTRTILARWHSEQEIDTQCLLFIPRVGLLNRKLALLSNSTRLLEPEFERIQKLICHPNTILLLSTIIQTISETSARHKDEFLRHLCVLLDAFSLIKYDNATWHKLCTQALNSKYYKHYLNESISSPLGPAHVFFVGTISQLAAPTDDPTLIELYSRFLVTSYDDTHLPTNVDFHSCTQGVLAQLQGSVLIDNYSCISAVVSLLVHASSTTTSETVRTFLVPILNILNSLCSQSKTAAAYLNSDQLNNILLQYVADPDHQSHTNACLLLAHTISEHQLNRLRIGYKLTMKCIDLLFVYSDNKSITNDILHSLLSLAIHEEVQSVIAQTYQLSHLIQLTKYYPVAEELIWILSFHSDIAQQLTSRHKDFLKQLSTSSVTNGILQNTSMISLSRTPSNSDFSFDVCIISSPNDHSIVQKIKNYLSKAGLRVGTNLHASDVLLCVSEETKYDCTCQTMVRQALSECKKITICIVKKPCRLDDWLGALVVQVRKPLDIVEREIEQILTELRYDGNHLPTIVEPRRKTTRVVTQYPRGSGANFTLPPPPPPQLPPPIPVKKVQKWTNRDVLQWCEEQKLSIFSKILTNYDGRNLLALAHLSRISAPHSIINQLRNDCRKKGIQLSFVEFVRFQTALDELSRKEQAAVKKQSIATLATQYVYRKNPSSQA